MTLLDSSWCETFCGGAAPNEFGNPICDGGIRLYAMAIEGCSYLIPLAVPEGYVNSCWMYDMVYEGKVVKIKTGIRSEKVLCHR